jgi:hypothetical protein
MKVSILWVARRSVFQSHREPGALSCCGRHKEPSPAGSLVHTVALVPGAAASGSRPAGPRARLSDSDSESAVPGPGVYTPGELRTRVNSESVPAVSDVQPTEAAIDIGATEPRSRRGRRTRV